MAPFGIFGLMYVPTLLIVPGDAAATANNIMASEFLFRTGIVSALIVQLIGILVVLYLYRLLKPVNKNLAALMVIFILIGAPIAMLSELNHLAALLLVSGPDSAVFTSDQLQALLLLLLDLHEHGINIAQIFWGLWLFPMDYLVYKSGYIPRILGILLMIGCFGFLFDSFTSLLFPNFDATVAQFTFWGELFLPLWLLIKGVNTEQWEKRVLESAVADTGEIK